jgi:phospholipid transport system substrate-binding protein
MIYRTLRSIGHSLTMLQLPNGRRLSTMLVMTALLSSGMNSVTAEPVASNPAASAIVTSLHEKLLFIMQGSAELGYQGRYNAIESTVNSSFDAPLIAKVIMSRYWRKLDDTQKMDFIDLFKRLSVATYASRFDGYSGESFVEVSTEMLKKGRLLIKTELQRPDDVPVKLDYLMHEKEGQWLMISVIANGVNDLSLKRAEYATVIKDKGFSGLIEDVAAKIKDMEMPDEE